jgi:hypothetical protein
MNPNIAHHCANGSISTTACWGGASLTANRVFCKKVDFLVCFACYISWLAQAIWLVSFLNKTNT